MAKRKRKAIPKSVRFEIFKRDSFTCQYCGAAAPDVVLELDHIKPHSQGGDEDIMNLITSCKACNSGKSDRALDDKSVIAKQKAQLDELNERRQQLEMMLEWREALSGIALMQENAVVAVIDRFGTYSPNKTGRADIRKWIGRYGLEAVLDATETSFDQYAEYTRAGTMTEPSWSKAFAYIPRIIANRLRDAEKPYMSELFYIRGIARNRIKYINEQVCLDLLEQAHLAGATIESLREYTKTVTTWQGMVAELEHFIELHGGEGE